MDQETQEKIIANVEARGEDPEASKIAVPLAQPTWEECMNEARANVEKVSGDASFNARDPNMDQAHFWLMMARECRKKAAAK